MLAKGYGFIYDHLNRLTTSRYGEGASCTSNVGRYDENLTFKYILTPEGRATYSSGAYTYEYFMKDHLGNTRISFNVPGSTAVIVQQSDYYPYGMAHRPRAVTTSDNRYLFNGKELQNNLLGGVNLDWYDYGARFYDPQIGRWTTVDPVANKYYSLSPYIYVANNPLIFIDPNGKKIVYAANLTDEQRQIYEARLSNLRTSNKYFSTIYNRLDASEQTYTLHLGNAKSGLGEFRPRRYGGGSIDFKSMNYFNDDYSFIEEFFHAYQADYYGVETMIDMDGDGDIPGASNKELEARFFKMAISAEGDNWSTVEAPGQEGLSTFTLGLMTQDKDFNLKIDFTSLTAKQKEQYLQIVKNFAGYWKEFNKQFEKGNVYDDTPTDEGPDAALDVFKKTNK